MKSKLGKLVVIDGTDGSGKATQIEMLIKYFKQNKIPYETLDFPRYSDNIYGELAGRYLKGEFGGIDEVSPYLAALTYAGDRNLAKPQMEKWLSEGKIILSNRYVPSSQAHMSAKLPKSKQKKFINWLKKLEYKTNGLPQEDLVLFLYVSPKLSQQNVDKKGDRGYLGKGKKDIHESDLKHLDMSSKLYLKLSKEQPHWEIIDCLEGQEMKSREKIHQEIIKALQKRAVLK